MKSVDYIELNALAIIYSCTIGQVHLLVSNTTEYYLRAMIAYLELEYLTPLGGLRVCYTDLIIPWYSYAHVYEHTKRAHKYKYVQIILVLLHPHQQV